MKKTSLAYLKHSFKKEWAGLRALSVGAVDSIVGLGVRASWTRWT